MSDESYNGQYDMFDNIGCILGRPNETFDEDDLRANNGGVLKTFGTISVTATWNSSQVVAGTDGWRIDIGTVDSSRYHLCIDFSFYPSEYN